ncbi:MAG: thiazole biosynthesis protein [Deltaproteobacteria bacterium]|nr:thiazole biosynthesis protein [Deltaproteobacteria bacterium]
MERAIAGGIISSYYRKLQDCLEVDVAVVGAGPSGLLCAWDLARAGKKVAVFERALRPGGGIWGGAMLLNEVALQQEMRPVLDEAGVRCLPAGDGLLTADAVELAAALIYQAVHAGARLFNGVCVEDVIFKDDRVCGVVINWSTVLDANLPVDPLMIGARCVLDAGGHDAHLTERIARKAGVRLDTPTGSVMGERPMWAERGEQATLDNSGPVLPGLYVAGMAANGVRGSFRMGPIFGGMLRSGRKVARLILEELG